MKQFLSLTWLANEWRDTIAYTVLIAFVIGGPMPLRQAVEWALTLCSIREVARSMAWVFQPTAIVGMRTVDPDVNRASAGFAGAIAIGVVMLAGGTPITFILALLNFGAALMDYSRAGGIGAMSSSYAETMWDYPRKRDGGGQTKKLVDSVKAMLGAEPVPAGAK